MLKSFGVLFILLAITMAIWLMWVIIEESILFGGFFIEDITIQIVLGVIALPFGIILLNIASSRNANCHKVVLEQ